MRDEPLREPLTLPLHELLYRPSAECARAVPFGLRSCGRYIVSGSWFEAFPGRHFGELYYGVRGTGFVLRPGQAMIMPPGVEQRLEPLDPPWEYRWFTVDGPRAAEVFGWFGLRLGIYGMGSQDGASVGALFDTLSASIQDSSLEGQRRCAEAAFRILSLLTPGGGEERIADPLVRRSLSEMHRRFSRSDFGVQTLALRLGVHRSRLSRAFRAELGRSPSEYLHALRTSTARSLLSESTLSVEEIALRCGYADPNYFSRDLRKTFGNSPTELRRGKPAADQREPGVLARAQ